MLIKSEPKPLSKWEDTKKLVDYNSEGRFTTPGRGKYKYIILVHFFCHWFFDAFIVIRNGKTYSYDYDVLKILYFWSN